MIKGYYIHNQKKDGSGVSKKIDAQLKVFNKHFDVEEIILSADKESWFARKIRMKILKKRARINYDNAFAKIEKPDFVYIRKQILESDFLEFLKTIKVEYPYCKVLMEVPTYPYWEEYPKNKIGKSLIEEEKRIIPNLYCYIDKIFSYTDYEEIFGIKTINIKNGMDVDSVPLSKYFENNKIKLIAVAMFSNTHGYDRLIKSIYDYYFKGGTRDVKLYLVGKGSANDQYEELINKYQLKEHIELCGFKTGRELDEIYDEADIGIGALGIYRIGLEEASVLKVGEYVSRGLPIVIAGKDNRYSNKGYKFVCQLKNDDSKIDLQDIIDFYDSCYHEKDVVSFRKQIRDEAYRTVDMKVVMQPIIDYILNN